MSLDYIKLTKGIIKFNSSNKCSLSVHCVKQKDDFECFAKHA